MPKKLSKFASVKQSIAKGFQSIKSKIGIMHPEINTLIKASLLNKIPSPIDDKASEFVYLKQRFANIINRNNAYNFGTYNLALDSSSKLRNAVNKHIIQTNKTIKNTIKTLVQKNNLFKNMGNTLTNDQNSALTEIKDTINERLSIHNGNMKKIIISHLLTFDDNLKKLKDNTVKPNLVIQGIPT